jgi:hypothetical protein
MKQLSKNRHDPHGSYVNNDAKGYHRGGNIMSASISQDDWKVSQDYNRLTQENKEKINRLIERLIAEQS